MRVVRVVALMYIRARTFFLLHGIHVVFRIPPVIDIAAGSYVIERGRGVVFGRNLVLRHAKKIALGDGVVLDDNCVVDAKGAGNRGISIGAGAYVGKMDTDALGDSLVYGAQLEFDFFPCVSLLVA